MLEIEKKRADEIDKTMSVSINLETGYDIVAKQNEDVN